MHMNDDAATMLINTVLFNLIMVGLDLFVLWRIAKRPVLPVTVACLGTWGIGLLAALLITRDLFAITRFFHYAISYHGAVVLAGSALILRQHSRPRAFGAIAAALLLIVVTIDAVLIEPTALESTRVALASQKVTRTYRIALIADLQTDEWGQYERRVLATVAAERPDLILWAGDTLQIPFGPAREELKRALNEAWRGLPWQPPLGSVAVRGNIDRADWVEVFASTPTRLAKDHTTYYDLGEIGVTALSLADSYYPRLRVPPTDKFHIVLGHSPDFALGEVHSDLLLAGHTHGGQIQIPGFGPLIYPADVPRAWSHGVTTLPTLAGAAGGLAERAPRTLVVSRGVGLERANAPRVRFWCRPQLVFIDVSPAPGPRPTVPAAAN